MKIDEKIEKYLVTEAKSRWETHPSDLEGLLDSGYYDDISKIDVVVSANDFVSGDEKAFSKKGAISFMRKMGPGASLKSIKDDTVVYNLDKSKVNTTKFNKFYDNLDEYGGGFDDVELLLFVDFDNVPRKEINNLNLNMSKVSANYMG